MQKLKAIIEPKSFDHARGTDCVLVVEADEENEME